MDWQYTSYAIPLIAASAITFALAVLAFRHRDAPGAVAFALQMAGLATWTMAYAGELMVHDLADKIVFAKLRYPGTLCAIAAWLAVCLHYGGFGRLVTRRTVLLYAIVPAITTVLVFSNEQHGQIWSSMELHPHGPSLRTDHGDWFWFHVAYCYATLAAGTVIISRAVRAADKRADAAPLLAAVLVPWTGNAIDLAGLNPGSVDPTAFSLTLSGVLFAWVILRRHFLDIVPGAREIVIERMSDGMMVLDGKQAVVDLNPAACTVIGRSREETLGRPAAEVLAAFPGLCARWRDVQDDETEVTAGSGPAQRHYDVRVSSLVDRAGRPTGRVVVLRDVTARRRAEADREALSQMLVHDMRNPLTSIVGSIEMLEGHPPREMSDRFLGIARMAADRMLALVNGILDVSRLEQGKMPLTPEPLSLAAMAAEALQLFAPQARESGVCLESEVPDDLPRVHADRAVLGRVLQNLVGNAVKFTRKGHVRVSAASRPDASVEVRVCDDGPGIPAEVVPRLFQRFAAGRQRDAGTGLGLAFCRLAVEAHGGRIGLLDTSVGTTIAFTLPTCDAGTGSSEPARAGSTTTQP